VDEPETGQAVMQIPSGAPRPRAEDILDLLPDGLVLFDRDGRCTYANRLAAALFPGREGGWPGAAVEEIFADNDLARGVRAHLPGGRGAGATSRISSVGLQARILGISEGVLVLMSRAPLEPEASIPGAAGRDLQRLVHELMQPLGAIANFAELIRGRTDGDLERFAERISAIARKTAEELRAAATPAAGAPATPSAALDPLPGLRDPDRPASD
jgi:PAS domain-containing protein